LGVSHRVVVVLLFKQPADIQELVYSNDVVLKTAVATGVVVLLPTTVVVH
jgi:hypothetical protein